MAYKPKAFSLTSADIGRMDRSRPHTPPYTPDRSKARLERADSPASSIHPVETVSPAKKSDKGVAVPDTIVIQELDENHPEYATNIELVYPHDLEEYDSETYMSEESASHGDESDSNIAKRLSQLHCEDPAGEARMHKGRRQRRLSKRLATRRYKRSHSQSVKSDSEVTDIDAMPGHDSPATARRLRRRLQGPPDMVVELTSDDAAQGSPRPRSSVAPASLQSGRRGRAEQRAQSIHAMDSQSPSDDQMDMSE